jgi:hypothetical protein
VGNDSYQVCGDFNNDSCSEWGVVDKCLGINPFCKEGFCFGCVTNSDCKEGVCINGKCEVDCNKSCADFGFKCGKKLICGKLLDCGSCAEGFFCRKGTCSDVPENALKISEGDCSPEYICSPWSECRVSFNFEELLSGTNWFTGKKSRLCFDSKKCYSTVKEEEDCLLNVEITSKKTNICGLDYIEIFDKKTNKLLARARDYRYSLGRTIEVFLLPGHVECAEEDVQFEVSWWERFFLFFDIKRIWRIII